MNPINNSVILEDMENIYRRPLDWTIFDKKTVLITGAYGMLASYVCFYLCYLHEEKHIDVRILAQGRNKDKMRNRFGELCDSSFFQPLYFNILSPINIDEPVDYIIHAAGGANPRLYSTNPVEVAEANTIGTYNLLKYASEINSKGFLFFSSGDVYGKINNRDYILEDDFGASDQLSDHACYSEGKRMGETFCRTFWLEYNVPTVIARIGHTYGPTMDVESDPRVFASFMRSVLHGEDIVMLSDGLAKRPFCYVADAVYAYLLLLINGKRGEAYNVCNTHEFINMRDLAAIMVGLRSDIDLHVEYKERQGDDSYVENQENKANLPSSEKLEKLGFVFEFTTAEGFGNVLRYYNEKN